MTPINSAMNKPIPTASAQPPTSSTQLLQSTTMSVVREVKAQKAKMQTLVNEGARLQGAITNLSVAETQLQAQLRSTTQRQQSQGATTPSVANIASLRRHGPSGVPAVYSRWEPKLLNSNTPNESQAYGRRIPKKPPPLQKLPLELLLDIFDLLDPQDYENLSLGLKFIRNAVLSPQSLHNRRKEKYGSIVFGNYEGSVFAIDPVDLVDLVLRDPRIATYPRYLAIDGPSKSIKGQTALAGFPPPGLLENDWKDLCLMISKRWGMSTLQVAELIYKTRALNCTNTFQLLPLLLLPGLTNLTIARKMFFAFQRFINQWAFKWSNSPRLTDRSRHPLPSAVAVGRHLARNDLWPLAFLTRIDILSSEQPLHTAESPRGLLQFAELPNLAMIMVRNNFTPSVESGGLSQWTCLNLGLRHCLTINPSIQGCLDRQCRVGQWSDCPYPPDADYWTTLEYRQTDGDYETAQEQSRKHSITPYEQLKDTFMQTPFKATGASPDPARYGNCFNVEEQDVDLLHVYGVFTKLNFTQAFEPRRKRVAYFQIARKHCAVFVGYDMQGRRSDERAIDVTLKYASVPNSATKEEVKKLQDKDG